MRFRRLLCFVSAVALLACAFLAGCAEEPAAGTPTPAAPEHVLRTLPDRDKDAISSFFSRWSAYTLALATGAADLGEVYTGLARMSDTWENDAYCTSPTGPSFVNLAFPDSDGRLALEVRDGAITVGSVEWNSEADDQVSATLTTMVACNALVYGLCAATDPSGAQNIYAQCIDNMERDADGLLTGGPEALGDYVFVLALDPTTQGMSFRGTRAASTQASPGSS